MLQNRYAKADCFMNQYWEDYFSHFREFYENCESTFFKYSDRISELTQKQKEFVNKEMQLEKLVGVSSPLIINTLLKSPTKANFAKYLIRSLNIEVDVHQVIDGESTFELLVKSLLLHHDSFYEVYVLQDLYRRGYKSRQSDEEFLRKVYKDIKTQTELEIWCVARFAFKLNDPRKIEKALNKVKVLFTIVSFKMKKPVGVRYPNLLGIANNAFLHYREDGDICLAAMRYYGVDKEIIARDHKKTFQYRKEDYEKYRPIQDEEFVNIIQELFPELAPNSIES
ncbi:MAG: hypothetical protein EOP48_03975 [Sphingobacteriales bacterium]|nr:MAG: hypothetical protein EOP48_03975 [Sphingobacteriales bacterium]